MTRLVRRIAACAAAAGLAFAQLTVSAYACPSQVRAAATPSHQGAAQSHQAAAPSRPTAAEHCANVATSNLCERHCNYGDSSLQSQAPATSAPDLAPLPWRIELISAPAVERRACKTLAPARTEPPPLVRFGVLRI